MLDKQTLLKEFHQPEDKLLGAKVLDQADLCLRKHIHTFTEFIDPYKTGKCLHMLLSIKGLHCSAFGGHTDTERKMIGFCPDYKVIETDDFPIYGIQIVSKNPFTEPPTHRDYLGSILGLGIDRSKVGDIYISDQTAVAFVHHDVANYVCLNLEKIGRSRVEVTAVETASVVVPQKNIQEIRATVSSLRVDAIISAGFRISRGTAAELIQAEKVFVNWMPAKSSSMAMKEGDFFTVRGSGRAQLFQVGGKTKKDRIGILIHRYI